VAEEEAVQWLYNRIMNERETFAPESYPRRVPWESVAEEYKDLWRQDLRDLLKELYS
jgi:hypothetical protein